MKKIVFTLIAAMAFVSMEANAQFKFGIKGGLNFENFDISGSIGNALKKENVASWDLGIVAQFPLVGSFHLQPEVLYLSQNAKIKNYSDGIVLNPQSGTSKISYFQVPINLLCKIDLIALKVFASGGVYLGYAVSRNEYSTNMLNKTDWGLSLGAGVEFMKFQVSAKYNWALQNVSDISNITWKSNRFNVSVAFFIL